MKKQWYDYLWVLSLTYLILGFFNILFAWLGLICFFRCLFPFPGGRRATVISTAEGASCLEFWEADWGCPENVICLGG